MKTEFYLKLTFFLFSFIPSALVFSQEEINSPERNLKNVEWTIQPKYEYFYYYGDKEDFYLWDDECPLEKKYEDITFVVGKKNQLGVIDEFGNELIPFVYKRISRAGKYFLIQDVFEKWGVFSIEQNDLVIPCSYDVINRSSSCQNIFRVLKQDPSTNESKAFLVNSNNRTIGEIHNVGFNEYEVNVHNIKHPKFWEHHTVYTDNDGNIMFGNDEILHSGWEFSEGLALCVTKTDECLILNESYQTIHKFPYNPEFQYDGHFKSGRMRIYDSDKKKYGYINTKGEKVTPFHFDDATKFNGNIAVVKRGEKTGVINRQGEYLIEPNDELYCKIMGYNENNGLVILKKRRKVKEVDNYSYFTVSEMGCIDQSGRTIIDFAFEEIQFTKNLIFASNSILSKPKVKKPHEFNIFASLGQQRKIVGHLYDSSGKRIINEELERASSLYRVNKYFLVSKEGKNGLMDKLGNFVVDPIYDTCSDVCEDFAIMSKDKKNKVIKYPNIELLEFEARNSIIQGNLIWIHKDGKWGAIDYRKL